MKLVIALVLNLLAAPMAYWIASLVLRRIDLLAYYVAASIGWSRRGIASAGSLMPALIGATIVVLIPLLVIAPLGWALGRWAPGVGGWILGSWGVWVGGAVALLLEVAHHVVPEARKHRLTVYRASFIDMQKESIAPNLSVRQRTYLKVFETALANREASKVEPEATMPTGGARIQPGTIDDWPHLEFEILDARARQPLASEPNGGEWTVLRCRLLSDEKAVFFLAERSGAVSGDVPMAWGEARLWVESAEDAGGLVAAFTRAFLGRPRTRTLTKPSPPLCFSTVVLSRDAGRSSEGGLVGGGGSWTATKWFYEEADEIFVNWSVEEKRGEFGEKDEAYRNGLVAMIEKVGS